MWMQAMIRIIQAAVLVIQTVRVGAQTSGESHAFYIGQHLTSFKACLMIEPYSMTVTVTTTSGCRASEHAHCCAMLLSFILCYREHISNQDRHQNGKFQLRRFRIYK
jgi:hypothetical protein